MARPEAIVVHFRGLSVLDLPRFRRHDHAAVLCAFRQRKDLLALTLWGDAGRFCNWNSA